MTRVKKIIIGGLFLLLAMLFWQLPKFEAPLTAEPAASPSQETTEEPDAAETFFFDTEEEKTDALLPDGKYAFLTFDDGPSRNTAQILDILNQYGIKGTFFVVGHSINGRNDSQKLLERIVNEGHYIGLHSMTHQAAALYYDEGAAYNFLGEMSQLQSLVKDLTGGFTSTLCRAPYGTVGTFTEEHISLLHASPLLCWDWNVDSHDWELETVADVLEQVQFDLYHMQRAPHAVILFHERDLTVEALPYVIEYLLAEGYELRPYNPELHFPINFVGLPDL